MTTTTGNGTLAKLSELAHNLWWSWNPECLDLFRELNPWAFQQSPRNPLASLADPSSGIVQGPRFQERVDHVFDRFRTYMDSPGACADAPPVAYLCMEFGLHETLPFYSGGLGILAGDHLKAASDLGLRFTAVGMFVREGYVHQQFDSSAWQQDLYPSILPDETVLELARAESGDPIVVSVDLGAETIHLRAWTVPVGRSRLYLLDSDFDANPDELRQITRRLYQGGRPFRIRQEMVLGVGGVRLLRALGTPFDVLHMNEGHCAFAAFELLRENLDSGEPLYAAEESVRSGCVFTTHTPVRAGHDQFVPDLFDEVAAPLAGKLGMSVRDLRRYGQLYPDDDLAEFNMTVLALRLSRAANGVSKLNGEVARKQWQELFPDRPVEDVPIGHVTNGIHVPTWMARPARTLATRLGGSLDSLSDDELWLRVKDLSDEELWEYRTVLRRRLVDFVYGRLETSSLPQMCQLDPEALTIGFARRFAPYKRAPLLFADMEQAAELFALSDRPIQMIYSGKAHPSNDFGKGFIQQIYRVAQKEPFRGRVIFLENYSMYVSRYMISGCDVWLNNPRRPMEASGTSGQKVSMHGGLNLSVLDGWWPEGFDGSNGWRIGADATSSVIDEAVQDHDDALALFDTLRNQVIPAFYTRNEKGIPSRWVSMMRSAMSGLVGEFSAQRMVRDYVQTVYQRQEVPAESTL
jgi:alpha-glucan phosphorylase-like protein